ncbi:MAG: hypothetical protein JXB18_04325 [Sedimentisphaerales bacterium]|nr:hypothetical protein [Sedimentisphaerales bacterium]
MPEWNVILASFTTPEPIGTTAVSMLLMFPLLAAISIIYKTTKLRAFFWKTMIRETVILFGVLSGFMILAIVVLNLVVWLMTS